MTKQEDIFKKIAESLLTDYSSVYYVDMNTNEYFWYSLDSKFHSLHLEQGGDDFLPDSIEIDCEGKRFLFVKARKYWPSRRFLLSHYCLIIQYRVRPGSTR